MFIPTMFAQRKQSTNKCADFLARKAIIFKLNEVCFIIFLVSFVVMDFCNRKHIILCVGKAVATGFIRTFLDTKMDIRPTERLRTK